MPFGTNTSLLTAFAGALGVYIELLRPGRVIPGIAGVLLLGLGGYSLWLDSPAAGSVYLIAFSALFFGLEALRQTHFIAGVAGTLVLGFGCSRLFTGAHRIQPVLAWAVAAAFGILTTLLADSARTARLNKRADLGDSDATRTRGEHTG